MVCVLSNILNNAHFGAKFVVYVGIIACLFILVRICFVDEILTVVQAKPKIGTNLVWTFMVPIHGIQRWEEKLRNVMTNVVAGFAKGEAIDVNSWLSKLLGTDIMTEMFVNKR